MNRNQLQYERRRLREERRKALKNQPRYMHMTCDRAVSASARFSLIAIRSSYERRRGR